MRVYLDFESNVAGEVFLVGESIDGAFRQVVLDRRLEGLARHHGMTVMTPEAYVRELFQRVDAENGVVVAYSTAEAQTLAALAHQNGLPLPTATYVNMARAAKTWVNHCQSSAFEALPPIVLGANAYQQRRQRWSLASIMRLTDTPAPADYAIGRTTSRINAVIRGLERRDGDYDRLTRVQKQKATKLLKHNRFDVAALETLWDLIEDEAPRALNRSSNDLWDVAV